MKVKDIDTALDALFEAKDFISHHGDGDETTNTSDLLDKLYEIQEMLRNQRYKQSLNTALAKVRKKARKP